MTAAGFNFIGREDVVRCPFCGVQFRQWEPGDDTFRAHMRWSRACGFVKGYFVGNIPTCLDDQPGRGYGYKYLKHFIHKSWRRLNKTVCNTFSAFN
jgi:hypothetical protein